MRALYASSVEHWRSERRNGMKEKLEVLVSDLELLFYTPPCVYNTFPFASILLQSWEREGGAWKATPRKNW